MKLAFVFTEAVLVAALAGTATGDPLKPAATRADRIWMHPGFSSFGVERIAMIPPATFDANFEAEKLVERAVVRVLSPVRYRWIAGNSARYLLRAVTGSDSALDAVRRGIAEKARVDSLDAPMLCTRLRCDAVLSVRVDLWERREMEWNQSGKPSTTIQLRAALVDSTGALLWSLVGSHTAEGPYHNPDAAPLGVSESGLERKPITGQGGAPSFAEVLDTLVERWASRFPVPSSRSAYTPATAVADSTRR